MKNKTTLLVLIILLAIGITLLGLNLNKTSQEGKGTYDQGTEKEFTTIKQGTSSAIDKKQNLVITSAARWSDLWNQMFPTEQIASAVDFEKNMIIAVFQGQKATGGYTIMITKIIETTNTIDVYVTETSPGENCIVTQAITSPYHSIELKNSEVEKTVRFYEDTILKDC
jgi:hypothetical protein